MIDTVREIVEVAKWSGPYGIAAFLGLFVKWYHSFREDKEDGLREGYRDVIKQKEFENKELQQRIEKIYEQQIAELTRSIQAMTEALTNVHNSNQAVANMMARVESKL